MLIRFVPDAIMKRRSLRSFVPYRVGVNNGPGMGGTPGGGSRLGPVATTVTMYVPERIPFVLPVFNAYVPSGPTLPWAAAPPSSG